VTSPEARIAELFDEIDDIPYGPSERALIDEAISLADEAGAGRLGYEARMRQLVSAVMTGDTDALLSSFAWLVGKNAADPVTYPLQVDRFDLLWYHKHIPNALTGSPLFALSDVQTAIEAMHEQYQRAGVGLSGVLQARFDAARATGQLEEAGRWLAEGKRTPRDDYSHCAACVRSQEAAYLYAIGQDEAGLALADEILDQNLSCGDEPESTMADALLPLLRAGRLDDARRMHLRGYRMARDEADKLSMIARHLEFCAVTGNEARGLELLERHLGWLAHDGLDAAAHFDALSAMGVLLDAVSRAGSGAEPIRAATDARLTRILGRHTGTWTVDDLSRAVWAGAADLAARFDERNGNDHHARRLQAARDLAAAHFDVPVGADRASLITPPPPVEPVDAEGFLRLARELSAVQEYTRAGSAVRAGLALDPDLAVRADLLRSAISVAHASGDPDGAAALLPERLAALRASGQDEAAQVQEALGLRLWGAPPEEQEAIVAQLRELLARMTQPRVRSRLAGMVASLAYQRDFVDDESDETPDGPSDGDELDQWALSLAREADDTDVAQAALASLARRRATDGDLEQAHELLEQALAEPGNRGREIPLRRLQAQILGGLGRFDAGLAAVEKGLALALELESRTWSVELAGLAANLANDAGRPDEAVTRLRIAARESQLGELSTQVGVRFQLGRQLAQIGRPDEALEELQEVLRMETDGGAPPADRATTLYWLGSAHHAIGEMSEAYGSWNTSIRIFTEAGESAGAVRSGVALAWLLARFDDTEALKVIGDAVDLARTLPDPAAGLIGVLHAAGRIRCGFNDDAGLADLREALELEESVAAVQPADTAQDDRWEHADLLDSLARGYAGFDRTPEAVAAALRAAAEFRQIEALVEAGNALLVAGRALVSAEQPEAALGHLEPAIDLLAPVPDLATQACLLAGDAYEALGRHPEAAAIRARVA
jgi:tetratricopeptide (TPR) repeat protein